MPPKSTMQTQVFFKDPGSSGKYNKCDLYLEWEKDCLQYKKGVFWQKLYFNKVVSWDARIGGHVGTFKDTRYPPSIVLKTSSTSGAREMEFVFHHENFENWLYWIIRSLLKHSKAPIPDDKLSGLSSKHEGKILNRRDLSAFDQSHVVFINVLDKLKKRLEIEPAPEMSQKTFGKDFQSLPKMRYGLPKDGAEGPGIYGKTASGISYGMVGKKIGKGGSDSAIYEIQKLLEPVLVKDTGSGTGSKLVRPAEPMVVKIPEYKNLDGEINESAINGLVREARILAILGRHPNIVGLIDAHVQSKERIYLFLEKGYDDLKHVKESVSTWSPLQIRKYAMDILAGIDHMHRRLVYHLDMKPENVILCKGDTAKIIDFGLSKTRTLDSKDAMYKETWYWVGTMSYISPESYKMGAIATETDLDKCDSFAVGMTLFNGLLIPYYGWKEIPPGSGLYETENAVLDRIEQYTKLVRNEANRKRLITDRLLILADAACGLIEKNPKMRLTVGEALEFMRADQKQHRKAQITSYRQEDLTSAKTVFTEYQYLKDQLKKSTE